MNPEVCQKCGESRAWKFWGACHCGYQFEPASEGHPKPVMTIPPKKEIPSPLLAKVDLAEPRKFPRLAKIAFWSFRASLVIYLGLSIIFNFLGDKRAADSLVAETKLIKPPPASVELSHSDQKGVAIRYSSLLEKAALLSYYDALFSECGWTKTDTTTILRQETSLDWNFASYRKEANRAEFEFKGRREHDGWRYSLYFSHESQGKFPWKPRSQGGIDVAYIAQILVKALILLSFFLHGLVTVLDAEALCIEGYKADLQKPKWYGVFPEINLHRNAIWFYRVAGAAVMLITLYMMVRVIWNAVLGI